MPSTSPPARLLVIPAMLLIAACSDPVAPDIIRTPPIDLAPEWQLASSAEHGFDSVALESALDDAILLIPGIRSVLVVRHGALVAERYYGGNHADTVNVVRAVTQSALSLIFGVAADRDSIHALDSLATHLDPAVDTLSAAQKPILMAHLLSMTSGLQWEQTNPAEFDNWLAADDKIGYLLDRPMANAPGTRFVYNSAAVHLVSLALTNATGLSALEFARAHLFPALGIDTAAWATDSRGLSLGAIGLELRPRDMAKLGQLVLQEGMSADQAVISPGWIRLSTRQRVGTAPFGYLWWTDNVAGYRASTAAGLGGQYIYVLPGLETVIVTTATWENLGDNATAQSGAIEALVEQDILGALR